MDPTRVREELGGEEGLRGLSRTARAHGLGLIVDIVPNHMAMSPRHNPALWEVLRDGPSSPRARWFDIDWEAQGGQMLLPVLGGPLGEEADELKADGDVLRYYDHAFRSARARRGCRCRSCWTRSGTARCGGGWPAPS